MEGIWESKKFTSKINKVEKINYLLMHKAIITARGGVIGKEKRRRRSPRKGRKS
jgi:hypothetical protein